MAKKFTSGEFWPTRFCMAKLRGLPKPVMDKVMALTYSNLDEDSLKKSLNEIGASFNKEVKDTSMFKDSWQEWIDHLANSIILNRFADRLGYNDPFANADLTAFKNK
jgi:trans-2-enoyl-CoA reductase